MAAGARLAAERERWPEQWQFIDFDVEEEQLLDVLDHDEELSTVVPAMWSLSNSDGEGRPVLVAATARRVLVVGGRDAAGEGEVGVSDVTRCARRTPRVAVMPRRYGELSFDIDADAFDRMWASIDALGTAAAPAD